MSQTNFNQGRVVLVAWLLQPGWPIEQISDNAKDLLGLDQLQKTPLSRLISDDVLEHFNRDLEKSIANQDDEFIFSDLRLKTQGTEVLSFYCQAKLFYNGENPEKCEALLVNDTHTLQTQARLDLVLEATKVGLWDWNPETNDVTYDDQWAQMLGYELNEIQPTFAALESRVHPEDTEEWHWDIEAHMEGKIPVYRNVHRMKHRDGHWRYILDRGKVVKRDAQGNPVQVTGTHTDITELKDAEKKLREANQELERQNQVIYEQATRDGLTGAGNRKAFDERLQQEWGAYLRSNRRTSLLLVDVDYFKGFNERFGHLAGDQCLKDIVAELKNTAARNTDYVCRFKGDQFAIILADTELSGSKSLAERARRNVEDCLIENPDSKIGQFITVTVGIAETAQIGTGGSQTSLLELAKKALDHAKQDGRNCVRWMPPSV